MTASDDDGRPTPEALLKEARREGRGRLKIFLGAYPGVGKTYAMLMAARERRKEGVDAVVGVIETHGRMETERLLRGLPVIPRRPMIYRGREFGEMDLDALLARAPKLALVDELAHTNVPGSRHDKRFQDVEELLAAGIDVYTTLNVQHVESLNDIVARIARVRVRETLPDHVLETADDIALVDLPPDELIQRLREGKVYVRDQAGRAIQHFFSKGNLTAFRELAMRIAAERVDAQMVEYMRAHAIAGPWPTQTRILVCVDGTGRAKGLVRAARRLADRMHAPWIAAYVRTPRHEGLSESERDGVAEALRLAERLGGEAVTLPAESKIADEILAYARARNVSHIVVGRPRWTWWPFRSAESVSRNITRRAEDFEIVLASAPATLDADARPRLDYSSAAAARWYGFGWATLAVTTAGVVAHFARQIFALPNLSLIFLTAVLVIAARFGTRAALFSSVLSFLSFNFFFTHPFHTFSVTREEDILTLALFLLVAILTGNLAARLKGQVEAMKAAARSSANLYDFSRKIAAAGSADDVLWAAVHHVASTLRCRSLVLLPRGGKLEVASGFPPEDQLEPRDWAAAEWTWTKGEPSGRGSDTLAASDWLFLPLRTRLGTQGVLGVSFDDKRRRPPDQRRLLEALADQVAVAIERTNLMSDFEETRLLNETERLRAALLSSVSHDLKTPLAAIMGAATTLSDPDIALAEDSRRDLIQSILDETARLHRFVQNLLDMTRISYGALQLNREWCEPAEIVGRVRMRAGKILSTHTLDVQMEDDLPEVNVDPVLIEHVLVNLLDNAAKYAPPATRVELALAREGDELVVSVTDEGPGIAEDEREAVFDQFYRIRGEDKRVAGTGLGLAICRGLVEAHGGRITMLPGPREKGACAVFRLPIETPPEPPPDSEPDGSEP